MRNKKVLVTGGAGFIGSHIVDMLIENGDRAIVIDDLSQGKKENINSQAFFYKIDIRDEKALKEIFIKEKPNVIFHQAADVDVRKSIREPVFNAEVNILGSLNLLELAKEFGIKKFIFASTGGAIYGDADIIPTPEIYPEWPLSPYGICKLTVEKYLNYYYKIFGLPFISLRYANVYGPRQNSKGEAGVIAIFCDKMLASYRNKVSGSGLSGKQPIINGNGKQTRDFVYIDDVVKANTLAMKSKKVGIYNIGTAKETNIITIFRELKKLTNSKCKEIHGPAQPGEQKRSCLDFSKIKKELGWQPKYSLGEGLKKTVEWFKQV